MISARMNTFFVHLAFFLSGAAALGYELAWTRMLAVGLGHELPGMLAVVTAFFGGLALGAWLLDGLVSRSVVPGRWYAGAELLAGAWALATALLLPWINGLLPVVLGRNPPAAWQWTVALVVPLLALAPATLAMGCTLPAIDRLCCRLRHDGRSVAGLYAVNTFGAVLGVLLAAYVLVPLCGYRASLALLASLSVASAALVWCGPAPGEAGRAEPLHRFPDAPARGRLLFLLFSTGLLGIGYEVLGIRVMSQVTENTVYSFASALTVYLLGTAAGAAVFQRTGARAGFEAPLAALLALLAVACGLGLAVLGAARGIYETARAALGGGFAGSVGAEMILALAVFGLPTLLMGALFSLLTQAMRQRDGGVGQALAVNTLGAALAPLLFGVVLMWAAGSKVALLIVAAGYVALLPRFRPLAHGAVLAVLLAVTVLVPDLRLLHLHPNFKLVTAREGVRATVAVVDDNSDHGSGAASLNKPPPRLLVVNNRFHMGGTGPGEFLQSRQAHLPLLLHAAPRRALFLGLGTGITFAAAGAHPDLIGDGVELLPEVVAVIDQFQPATAALYSSDRLRVHVADARRFVQAAGEPYDVIVADLFHPYHDGAGALYTVEHFDAIRRLLAPDGLFCQWLPLYQLDEDVLKIIIRSFLKVFPEARGWWCYFNAQTPVLGLIGEARPRRYPADWYERRVTAPQLADSAASFGLGSTLLVLGTFAAAPRDLQAFAGPGPLNTNDHPVVAFRAPRHVYRKDRPGHANLLALMASADPDPAGLLEPGGIDLAPRLGAYVRARDTFFRARILIDSGMQREGEDMLVDSAGVSADFPTGYETVLYLAEGYRRANRARAVELLKALNSARPERGEARSMLEQLQQQR
jgi:spermidine synthase